MQLHRIEQFIAVVDAGSIRGAARRLGMLQPTLTRSLQQLEDELGVQLLQRSVHGASLTKAGAAFLVRARVAEAELRLGANEARSSLDGGAGMVSVGVSPSAASLLLPEFVLTLRQQRPQVRIRLLEQSPGALLPSVREAALDMAVTAHAQTHRDGGLSYRPLWEIQLRVAARRGHPLAAAHSLAELVQAPWLSMAEPGNAGDLIRMSFLAAGLSVPVPAVYCNSHSVALDLIAASDMIGFLPPTLLRSCIAAGTLVELPLTQPLAPLIGGLYMRADSIATPAAKAAVKVIVALARRFTSSGELRRMAPIAEPSPSHR